MNQVELIAEYLCNHQPYPIRNRLLDDKDFISKYNLRQNAVITIGGQISVNQNQLIPAIRKAFKENDSITLHDLNGDAHTVTIDQGHIKFVSSSKEFEAKIDFFKILSPNTDIRTNELKKIVEKLGPTVPDYSGILKEAESDELSYENINLLLHELFNGVVALQNKSKQAFDTQQTTIDNLVPDCLSYYENFCGPNPVNCDPEYYFESVLPRYRESLINRNKLDGLDVCLQGALRDNLMPGRWTIGYSNDELWVTIEACDPFRDPFALLGGLDIALYRQKDERFKKFAEKAVSTLIKDEFPRNDGVDVYELLPMLAKIVLNRLNVIENGALRPPFWKRMCAWMQAGFLIRQTQNFALDLEGVKNWISANMTQTGTYAALLDLKREPMFQASEMSRSSFRQEVLGRLHIARDRHKKEERYVPHSDDIDAAISNLEAQGLPLGWALPGPLDGHICPKIKKVKLPEEAINQFSDDLFNDQAVKVLSTLTYLSQLYDFGSDLLSKVRTVVNKSDFEDGFINFPELLTRIIDTGFIACAHRDIKLARAIGDKIVSVTPYVNQDFNVGIIITSLLIAGSAFENEDDWAKWMRNQLSNVAYRLPAGDKLNEFLWRIREVKKVLNFSLNVTSKAEAIASSGA